MTGKIREVVVFGSPKVSRRVEYHRELKLDSPDRSSWETSSAFGFHGRRVWAISEAREMLKNGRWGYKVRAVRVVKYTVTTVCEVVWECSAPRPGQKVK